MIIIAAVEIPTTPLFLFSHNIAIISVGMLPQGLFAGGGLNSQNASYLTERFPTEVRATATGFCYQLGAIAGGVTVPIIAYFATTQEMGFATPDPGGHGAGLREFHPRDSGRTRDQRPHSRRGEMMAVA